MPHVYNIFFRLQVLRVINPNVKYTPTKGSPHKEIDAGVAIILTVLQVFDKLGISYSNEACIRIEIRRHRLCNSTSKQYFLIQESTRKKILRSDESRFKTCSCLSKSSIPQQFFDAVSKRLFRNDMFIYTLMTCLST